MALHYSLPPYFVSWIDILVFWLVMLEFSAVWSIWCKLCENTGKCVMSLTGRITGIVNYLPDYESRLLLAVLLEDDQFVCLLIFVEHTVSLVLGHCIRMFSRFSIVPPRRRAIRVCTKTILRITLL